MDDSRIATNNETQTSDAEWVDDDTQHRRTVCSRVLVQKNMSNSKRNHMSNGLKEYVRKYKRTVKKTMPVFYKVTPEMLVQFWEMKNKIKEMGRKMKKIEKQSIYEDTEASRIPDDLLEKSKHSLKSDSETFNKILDEKENTTKILKLESKTDAWFEMMDSHYRKNQDLMQQMKYDFDKELQIKETNMQNQSSQIQKTMIEIKEFGLAQENKWSDINEKLTKDLQVQKETLEAVLPNVNKNSTDILSLTKIIDCLNTDLHKQSTFMDEVAQCLVEIIKVNAKVEKIQTEMDMSKEEIERIKTETETLIKTQNEKVLKIDESLEESKLTMNRKIIEQVSRVKKKVEKITSGLNTKLSKVEEVLNKKEHFQIAPETNLRQKVYLLENCVFKIPKMTLFDIITQQRCYKPDLTWNLTEFKKIMNPQKTYNIKLHPKAFELKSEVFVWKGYDIRAQAKIEVKDHDDRVYMSLCLEEHNIWIDKTKMLIPNVFYCNYNKPKCSEKHYLFPSVCSRSLHFDISSWLIDEIYSMNTIDIYVEPPQPAHSYDGALIWAIDNYSHKRLAKKNYNLLYHESPYFYTGQCGYRVQARIWPTGFGEYSEKGVSVQVSFLNGEFDDDLPGSFPHQTTVTLINKMNPALNITKSVVKDIEKEPEYSLDMCTCTDCENLVVCDMLFYNVVIKALT